MPQIPASKLNQTTQSTTPTVANQPKGLLPATPKEREDVQTVVMVTQVNETVALVALRRARNVDHAVALIFDDIESLEREAAKYEVPDKKEKAEGPSDSNYVPPSTLIANNQDYFHLLLRLLEVKGVVTEDVWQIVDALPPNTYVMRVDGELMYHRELENTLRELEGEAWKEQFDPSSVYRLLYTLQIVDGIMKPKGDAITEAQTLAAREWCRKFFYVRGMP